MKREVSRRQGIPAFSADLGELESIVLRLRAHFPPRLRADVRLVLEERDERLEFVSVAELRSAAGLPSRLRSLEIIASDGANGEYSASVHISPKESYIKTRSPDDAWNAGASEIVVAWARRHQYWYGGHQLAIETSILAVLSVPFIGWYADAGPTAATVLALILGMIAAGFAQDTWGGFFPTTQIVVVQKDAWWRSRQSEITIVLAIAALLVSLLTWLFPMK